MSEQSLDFGPWEGNQQQFEADAQFQDEQKRELEYLDEFCGQRDALLKGLDKVRNLSDLLALHDRFHAVMTEAESQVKTFRFLNPRMEDVMDQAQAQVLQKTQAVRDKLGSQANPSSDLEHERVKAERIRRSHQETTEILAQVRRSQRGSQNQVRPAYLNTAACDYRCPRCNKNKLLAHTYCHTCSSESKRVRRW